MRYMNIFSCIESDIKLKENMVMFKKYQSIFSSEVRVDYVCCESWKHVNANYLKQQGTVITLVKCILSVFHDQGSPSCLLNLGPRLKEKPVCGYCMFLWWMGKQRYLQITPWFLKFHLFSQALHQILMWNVENHWIRQTFSKSNFKEMGCTILPVL